MEVLAIIPARGGSKGIKNKNIRLFGGLPLIARAILEAKKSKYISRILLSTDREKIAGIGKKYGAEVPFLRPAKLARDKSLAQDAFLDVLDKLWKRENYVPDYIIILQPTTPLRTAGDIDGAFRLLLKRKGDELTSICRTENLIFNKDKNDKLSLINPELPGTGNRQQLLPAYKLDGAMISIIKTKKFLKNKKFHTGNLLGYEIDRWRVVDLDEPQDFVVGEIIYKNRNKISNKINKFK